MTMSEGEALLLEQAEKIKKLPFKRLTELMGAANILSYETTGKAGTEYDVEVESAWAGETGGDLRVHIALFERTWDNFIPLAYTFVITPGGEIKGEEISG